MRKEGKVVSVDKVYMSRKELAKYLGVTERYLRDTFDKHRGVELYRISERCVLYRKENIDSVIQKCRLV